MNPARLGAFIRSIRVSKGMTQQSLAEALHVTDKAVSKWERGLSLPDIGLFSNLANVLNVSASDLLLESSDEKTPSNLVQIYEDVADIRAPLHIILGCAELLRKYRKNDELFERYLESIRISGEYLLAVAEKSEHPGQLDHLLSQHVKPFRTPVTAYDFTGKRILVVEDMEVNREIAAEILRGTGASVDFAEDGQVCLDIVSSSPPEYYDLILMDIVMPRMNGLEATRKLRQMGYSLPIVAMTANVSDQDRNIALEAGMNAFAEKPIFIEKLFAVMNKYIQENSTGA